MEFCQKVLLKPVRQRMVSFTTLHQNLLNLSVMQIATDLHTFLNNILQLVSVQADESMVIQLNTAHMYLCFFITDPVGTFTFQCTDLFQKIDHSVYCSHSDIRISLGCHKINLFTAGTLFFENDINDDLSLSGDPAALLTKTVHNGTPLHIASLILLILTGIHGKI